MGGFKQRPEFHLINVFSELTQRSAGRCDQRDESAGAGEFFLVGGGGSSWCDQIWSSQSYVSDITIHHIGPEASATHCSAKASELQSLTVEFPNDMQKS